MLDMIHPAVPGKVSLNDLKRCQMTPIFFDTFFNLEKYLDHEQRDPFASQRDPDSENGEDLLKVCLIYFFFLLFSVEILNYHSVNRYQTGIVMLRKNTNYWLQKKGAPITTKTCKSLLPFNI